MLLQGSLHFKKASTVSGHLSRGTGIARQFFNLRYGVLLMQLGFAFLEAGCVRYKNMQSIMIKVFMNAAIAIIMWWVVKIC
jgi:hypothetical protein